MSSVYLQTRDIAKKLKYTSCRILTRDRAIPRYILTDLAMRRIGVHDNEQLAVISTEVYMVSDNVYKREITPQISCHTAST